MEYSLAKELKDAGFPQRHEDENWPPEKYIAPDKKIVDGKPEHVLSEELAYVPTLSELIEACAAHLQINILFEPRLITDKEPPVYYTLASYPVLKRDHSSPEGVECLSRRGATPEEAVAKLWLAFRASFSEHPTITNRE